MYHVAFIYRLRITAKETSVKLLDLSTRLELGTSQIQSRNANLYAVKSVNRDDN
jgi:hypothetical protein